MRSKRPAEDHAWRPQQPTKPKGRKHDDLFPPKPNRLLAPKASWWATPACQQSRDTFRAEQEQRMRELYPLEAELAARRARMTKRG